MKTVQSNWSRFFFVNVNFFCFWLSACTGVDEIRLSIVNFENSSLTITKGEKHTFYGIVKNNGNMPLSDFSFNFNSPVFTLVNEDCKFYSLLSPAKECGIDFKVNAPRHLGDISSVLTVKYKAHGQEKTRIFNITAQIVDMLTPLSVSNVHFAGGNMTPGVQETRA